MSPIHSYPHRRIRIKKKIKYIMEKTMKQLFNEKKKLVKKTNDVGRELDKMIIEKWGFSFSDTDDDPIIDTLDYGTNSISFENFVSRMNTYKSQYDGNGKFFAIP